MKKYLLTKEGRFYKANLHSHSTVSDGKLTPEEMKAHYKENGYSILAYTDHDVFVAHPELTDEDFLVLHGYEASVDEKAPEGPYFTRECHFCLIALDPDNRKQPCWHRTKFVPRCAEAARSEVQFYEDEPDYERVYSPECISEMMQIGRERGFFVTYNHPNWSLESYNDYINYHGMHAMEVCNYGTLEQGYPAYAEREYDDMLRAGKRIFCIGTDDNHNWKNDSFGAFTMIKADKLEYKTVTDALVKGNFYASEAPEIYDLWFENGTIHIDCSPARRIILHGAGRYLKEVTAPEGEMLTSAEFEVLPEFKYVRLTVHDAEDKHANTNAYFTDELFE